MQKEAGRAPLELLERSWPVSAPQWLPLELSGASNAPPPASAPGPAPLPQERAGTQVTPSTGDPPRGDAAGPSSGHP